MKQDQGIQLELKEMDHKVNKFQRDSKEAATKVPFSFCLVCVVGVNLLEIGRGGSLQIFCTFWPCQWGYDHHLYGDDYDDVMNATNASTSQLGYLKKNSGELSSRIWQTACKSGDLLTSDKAVEIVVPATALI